MKLNLKDQEREKATMGLSVRVKPSTYQMCRAICLENPEFQSFELIDFALKSLIKEYGENNET